MVTKNDRFSSPKFKKGDTVQLFVPKGLVNSAKHDTLSEGTVVRTYVRKNAAGRRRHCVTVEWHRTDKTQELDQNRLKFTEISNKKFITSCIFRVKSEPSALYKCLGGFATNVGAAGTDAKGTQWFNGGALTFDGINIVMASGLANNTAVAAEKSNLFFGTGLMSDQNEVKVIDMADIDGSQNVRVVMRFTAGIQHAIGSDIVLYS